MPSKKRSQPALSIVVPAYNEEKYIADCLKSLTRQVTEFPYEVIVVDNSSTDRTRDIVKKFPTVTLISEQAKGYGEAARTGVRIAKADLIAMTDADTRVNPQWVQNYVSAYRNEPDVVAFGGTYEYYDGPLAVQGFVKLFNLLSPRLITRYLCGMNMSFRRSAYDAIGGFETGVNLQADQLLGLKLARYGKIKFLRNNKTTASARRYTKPIRTIRELGIRSINTASFALLKEPVIRSQTDIR